MTVTGRAGSIRRNKRSASQMIVAGLVVLAVVASLFLIFSESVQVLRIGLMAALWAAVIGAIAMTRYRRESAADKAKIRDMQTVYELQLEREISARREYEAGVEARVRSELEIDGSEIAALRVELAALRGSLEILFDGRMPVDRVAIASDASRMGQLAGPAAAVRPPVPFAPNPAYTNQSAGPTFATPFDEPVTAEVSVVGDEDEETDAGQGPRVAVPRTPVPEPSPRPEFAKREPVTPRSAEPPTVAASASEQASVEAANAEDVGAEEANGEVAGVEAVDADTDAADEGLPPARRARRRAIEETADGVDAGAHSSGLTVAEIMANMQAQNGGGDTARSGRRRRGEP